MFDSYFAGKTILVTGVAGVKGSWLAYVLLRAGATVIGVDTEIPPDRSNFASAGLRDSIEFVHGDVADLGLMRNLLSRCDAVFHLAAVAIVREALEAPHETYRSNTMGVVAVLEAIRLNQRPIRAVFVTTDKVYHPKQGELWLESDPLVATGPYAVSKACAEFVIQDYYYTYFRNQDVRIGVGRAGNVVIGGDLHSSSTMKGGGRIFVDCFEALAEGRSPEIFSPTFTRPYTYGLDILSGYMSLMSELHRPEVNGQAFNFGPCEQYGVTNAMLATKICDLWGGDLSWHSGKRREEPFEFQSLSIRKSQEILGWRPVYTLYESLRDTADWYREWSTHEDTPPPGCMIETAAKLADRYERSAQRVGVKWATSGTGVSS